MLRSNLRVLGITEVKTTNGGRITATNARSKESVKAQATFTGSTVTATIKGKDVVTTKHNINKAARGVKLHKLIDKIYG